MSFINPFPGLRPFSFDDAALFFGRDLHVQQLREKLARHRFCAVVGRSGDGKSSLARAGLRPLLASELDKQGEPVWLIDEMRPGGAPMAELAAVVDRIATQITPGRAKWPEDIKIDRTMAMLRRSSLGLVDALEEAQRQNSKRILIIVDQFEEIFRFDRKDGSPKDFEEAAAFVDLILQASRAKTPHLNIVITMRSDFLGDCPRFRELPEAINDSQFLVPRLTRSERRMVVEQPVYARGATIEPALVQRLLNDAGDAPDMLPVLQHAMMRTWDSANAGLDEGKAPHLELQHYDALGGIGKALSNHADEILSGFDGEEQEVAQTTFQALVDIDLEGRATRRTPAPRLADLVALVGGNRREALMRVLEAFRGQGRSFLMPPQERELFDDTVIDISHEALIRRWRRIRPWVDAEMADARVWRLLLEAIDAGQTSLSGSVARDRIAWITSRRETAIWAARYGGRSEEVDQLLTSSQRQLRRERLGRFALVAASVTIVAVLAYAWDQENRLATSKQALIASQELGELDRTKNSELAALNAEVREEKDKVQKQLEKIIAITSEKDDALRVADENAARALASRLDELGSRNFVKKALRVAGKALSDEIELPKPPQLQASAYRNLQMPFMDSVASNYTKLFLSRSELTDAMFSPDGSQVATADQGGNTWIWDMATRKGIVNFVGHTSWVNAIAYAPNGAWVATAGNDQTARIWDAATGSEVTRFDGHTDLVNSVVFSPDGTRLATASWDGTARIWSAATGAEITRLEGHEDFINSVAFSPDGALLATAGNDLTARIWDAATGAEITRFRGHEGWVTSVAFSPDGARLATASNDRTARIWDAATGSETARLEGHGGSVIRIAFARDGARLATAGDDGIARIWSVATGEEIARLEGHKGYISSIGFSPDGTRLVTAGEDKLVRIWNARSVLAPETLEVAYIDGASFTPDGLRYVTSSKSGATTLWDADKGVVFAHIERHEDCVNSYALSPNGKQLAVTSKYGVMRIKDTTTREEIVALEGRRSSFTCVAFAPDGARLAAASADGAARIWNAATGKQIAQLKGYAARISSIAFSPDGEQLAMASDDGTTRIWDVITETEITRFEGHENWVSSVAYSPDGTQVATASDDGTARIWDAETGAEIVRFVGHESWVSSVSYSPDGARLATASADGTARIWDVVAGAEIARLEGHQDYINSVSFSPDGARLVTASDDGSAQIWDAETWVRLETLHAKLPDDPTWISDLRSKQFSKSSSLDYSIIQTRGGMNIEIRSQSGDVEARLVPPAQTKSQPTIISGGRDREALLITDGRLSLWRWSRPETSEKATPAPTVSPVAWFEAPSSVEQALFSPDGTNVAARLQNGSIRVWRIFADASGISTFIDGLGFEELSLLELCEFELRSEADCLTAQ